MSTVIMADRFLRPSAYSFFQLTLPETAKGPLTDQLLLSHRAMGTAALPSGPRGARGGI